MVDPVAHSSSPIVEQAGIGASIPQQSRELIHSKPTIIDDDTISPQLLWPSSPDTSASYTSPRISAKNSSSTARGSPAPLESYDTGSKSAWPGPHATFAPVTTTIKNKHMSPYFRPVTPILLGLSGTPSNLGDVSNADISTSCPIGPYRE